MKRRRQPPVRARDPDTREPIEPPLDDLIAERQQCISLALQRARRSGRPYDEGKVIALAKIDWQRRQASERRRKRRTRSIEDILDEPSVPSHEAAVDAKLDVPILIASLTEREKSLIALLFIQSHSRRDVALILNVSPKTVTNTIADVLKTIHK
jgi:DNA-directed RNA polymerase specialized sigma24 family protein